MGIKRITVSLECDYCEDIIVTQLDKCESPDGEPFITSPVIYQSFVNTVFLDNLIEEKYYCSRCKDPIIKFIENHPEFVKNKIEENK